MTDNGQSQTPFNFAVNSITTLFGQTISGVISAGTPHMWTADSNGLFHTTSDLATEWQGFYQQMLAGGAEALTPVQRMEGNAEAVFENTNFVKLNKVNSPQIAVDREDAQREFDAIAGAMQINAETLGISQTSPFNQQTYLQLEKTLQGNAPLEELAMQGHGLNSPTSPRYNGYTNDFQTTVDGKTLFTGGGIDNGKPALPQFFDDVVLSHVPFPTVAQQGQLEQLNQNANPEDTVANAVLALNQSAYNQVFLAADFVPTGTTPPANGPVDTVIPVTTPPPPKPGPGQMVTLFGDIIPTTISTTPHVWTAGSDGLFHTTTNLATEWQTYYTTMLNGGGGSLTAIQRLEGNAEAVFENTNLAKLAKSNAGQLVADREDVQRQLDAMAVAMQIDANTLGISPTASFTQASYLALEQAIRNNAILEELSLQGHGVNLPTAPRYNGFLNDFQHTVDAKTLYVGPGLNSGKLAIGNFFADDVLTNTPFPTVAQNGTLEQLNQNGLVENALQDAINAVNQSAFGMTYINTDFVP